MEDTISDTSSYVGHGRVQNKVAVVTGGSKAIGKTVCEVLAKEGATVYFCGREAAAGLATRDIIVGRGGKVGI